MLTEYFLETPYIQLLFCVLYSYGILSTKIADIKGNQDVAAYGVHFMYRILFLYEEKLRVVCQLHSNVLKANFECYYSQIEANPVIEKIQNCGFDLIIAYLYDMEDESKKELSKILTNSPGAHFMLCGAKEELHKYYTICGKKIDRYLMTPIKIKDFVEVTKQLLDKLNGVVNEEAPKINETEEFVDMRSKILIVDDSPVSLRTVVNWLKDEYKTAVAKSGKAALEYLEKEIPEIILLDYEMPEMSGVQTLEAIRSDSRWANIPIIFLTAVSEMDMVKEAIRFKPDGYILKSAGMSPLQDKIKEVLSKRGK